MGKHFNICTIYIILWLVYNLQGIVYESGTTLSQSILFLIYSISIYHLFIVNTRYKLPRYFKGLNYLLGLFTIYGLILIISGEQLYITEGKKVAVKSFGYLKTIYASMLPIYSFYYFTRKRLLTEDRLRVWIVLFFIIAVFQYFRAQREAIEQMMLTMGSNVEEITNNCGYMFVALIPATLLFYKKPLVQYIAIGVCMIFILMAMKRGAIIIGVMSLMYMLWKNYQTASRSQKIRIGVLTICLLCVAYWGIEQMLANSDYFNRRIEATLEGQVSKRDIIYSNLWNKFLYDSSIIQMFFGRGAFGTLKVGMNYAHNDWLEILTNQGLLGIALFIYYWLCFYKTYKNQCFTGHSKTVLTILIMCLFTKTLFSMSYGDMSIYTTSILGFTLAGGFQYTTKPRLSLCPKTVVSSSNC